jgi:hypothetical protein
MEDAAFVIVVMKFSAVSNDVTVRDSLTSQDFRRFCLDLVSSLIC